MRCRSTIVKDRFDLFQPLGPRYVYNHHVYQSIDQPGKVANPACGQLNRKKFFSLSPLAPDNVVSRDRFVHPVPRHPAHSSHPG